MSERTVFIVKEVGQVLHRGVSSHDSREEAEEAISGLSQVEGVRYVIEELVVEGA